jgi:hypothetical protein
MFAGMHTNKFRIHYILFNLLQSGTGNLNPPLLWCWQLDISSGVRELTNAMEQSPSWETLRVA